MLITEKLKLRDLMNAGFTGPGSIRHIIRESIATAMFAATCYAIGLLAYGSL